MQLSQLPVSTQKRLFASLCAIIHKNHTNCMRVNACMCMCLCLQGRAILQSTVDLVQNTLGLEVSSRVDINHATILFIVVMQPCNLDSLTPHKPGGDGACLGFGNDVAKQLPDVM